MSIANHHAYLVYVHLPVPPEHYSNTNCQVLHLSWPGFVLDIPWPHSYTAEEAIRRWKNDPRGLEDRILEEDLPSKLNSMSSTDVLIAIKEHKYFWRKNKSVYHQYEVCGDGGYVIASYVSQAEAEKKIRSLEIEMIENYRHIP